MKRSYSSLLCSVAAVALIGANARAVAAALEPEVDEVAFQHAFIKNLRLAPDSDEHFERNSHPDAQWYPKAGLGLFIHWGLSSAKGWHDLSWGMIKPPEGSAKADRNSVGVPLWGLPSIVRPLPPNEYWKQIEGFDAANFHPKEFLAAAHKAGFQYAILTTKHHEGFALWPSSVGDLNTKRRLGGRDLVKEFVDACRAVGMKAGLYYSPPDWYFDRDYMSFSRDPKIPDAGCDWEPRKRLPRDPMHEAALREMTRVQIEELLTRYGKIDMLWFDGMGSDVVPVKRIRELQPSCIINDRGRSHGDFLTQDSECRFPAFRRPEGLWWEYIQTLNDGGWGYRSHENYKSAAWFLCEAAKARAWGGNFVANVCPNGHGEMPYAYYKVMHEIAEWMEKNGAALRDAEPTDFWPERCNVPVTRSGRTLHFLYDWLEDGDIVCRGIAKPLSVSLGGKPLAFAWHNGMLTIPVPYAMREMMTSVVEVEEDPRMDAWRPAGLSKKDIDRLDSGTVDSVSEESVGPVDFAEEATVVKSDCCQYLRTDKPVKVDCIEIGEDISNGQFVTAWKAEARVGGKWRTVAEGKTIGRRRLVRFEPVESDEFRVTVTEASGPAKLKSIALRQTNACVLVRREPMCNAPVAFARDGKGTVAFIGGSITEMNGYRPLMMAALTNRFPKTSFTFTSAGIGSTCSDTGAFRFREDVLAKGVPDLLFVEFAVNDEQDGHFSREHAIRGMEGVVRQARLANPAMDIVMIFFLNDCHLNAARSGKTTGIYAAHDAVAERYGISTLNVSRLYLREECAGRMTWADYADCHPRPKGNAMVAAELNALLDCDGWRNEPAVAKKPYTLPEPLDPGSYFRGRFLPFSSVKLGEGWSVAPLKWRDKGDGLVTTTPGAECLFSFAGTALGVYHICRPDDGIVEVSIDGGGWREVSLWTGYSPRLRYPHTVMLADGLDDAMHTARIRLSGKKASSDASGTAAQFLRICVNGDAL